MCKIFGLDQMLEPSVPGFLVDSRSIRLNKHQLMDMEVKWYRWKGLNLTKGGITFSIGYAVYISSLGIKIVLLAKGSLKQPGVAYGKILVVTAVQCKSKMAAPSRQAQDQAHPKRWMLSPSSLRVDNCTEAPWKCPTVKIWNISGRMTVDYMKLYKVMVLIHTEEPNNDLLKEQLVQVMGIFECCTGFG